MTTWSEFKKNHPLSTEDELMVKMEEDIIRTVSKLREEQQMTQCELAEKCNLKQSAIARLEKLHHSPRVDSLIKILAQLGYTLKIVPISEVLDK